MRNAAAAAAGQALATALQGAVATHGTYITRSAFRDKL